MIISYSLIIYCYGHFMKNITAIIFLFIFTILSTNIYADRYYRYSTVIDTQTAYTYEQGIFQMSLLAYNSGGIQTKLTAGLTNDIYFGVSLDVEHLIGKEKIEPNVPGVVFKWRITDGPEYWPISLAIGYDSFYMGEVGKADNNLSSTEEQSNYNYSKLNKMIYGPYAVITKPLYAFGSEQHFNIGVRLPTQPDYVPIESSYYISLDIPFGSKFVIKGEIERLYWNFDRLSQCLANTGIRYNIIDKVGIDFSFRFEKDEKPNRVIRIEYNDKF